MSLPHHPCPSSLPRLSELGRDLLTVSRRDVAVSLIRPLFCFGLFWVCALSGHWMPAVLAVGGLMFFTYTSTSHDLVHRTLHLPERINDVLLALLEALTLRSGHAFRLTHLQHHKYFPQPEDVEGARAAGGFWAALRCGPGHQFRLFHWAWRKGNPVERRWMAAEAAIILLLLTSAVFWSRQIPALAVYVVLVVLGSWLYPLATVWWPHRAEGRTVCEQTRCFRGRFIPAIFFQHTYHLEHHLYPGVSSHRWAELARRLEPHLRQAGVEIIQLP